MRIFVTASKIQWVEFEMDVPDGEGESEIDDLALMEASNRIDEMSDPDIEFSWEISN